ncbi:MAG: SPOR domain-containing protein [Treponema sp.]|jgi:DedD protein|nr:SPOR domain-containing protein [Treponema sp.]
MEKEQKKLLLVAVSVGVFLLVTITIAIFLITQKTVPQETAVSWSNTQTPAIIPPAAPPVIDPFIEPLTTESAVIEEEPFDIDTSDGDSLTIRIPSPTTAAVPDNPQIVNIAPAAPKQTTPATPPAARQPATPRQTTSGTTAAASSSNRPATPRTINDFWIQTGAFEARVRAEDAKDVLEKKGLVSIIENREINGKVWYRVRLGPYTSQKEAEYWLSLVKSIDGFGQSQVRQTARTQ